jgi:hypothetical protein
LSILLQSLVPKQRYKVNSGTSHWGEIAAMATMTETTSDTTTQIESKLDDFPIIDFSSFENDPERTAAEIFNAASQWGFLVLKGHGIPQNDIDEMFAMVSKDCSILAATVI